MKTSNQYENLYWDKNQYVIGIDEAGRGPLAGPVVVAGVIFPIGYDSKDIYDSKKLSLKKREELYKVILEDALYYNIQIVDEKDVDKYNIYQATKMANERIVLDSKCQVVLTDAMKLQLENYTVYPIIKGDQKSCSIAAGSILAKVTRDHIMDEYDAIYPQYGFKQHKGYPTKAHLQALQQYGPCPIHRFSYGPVMESNQLTLF
ncbi:MAG: ribonuclease HII [Erysipelotrichaceae bacterium]|nr:ribonuclease HII [Erysipelotrichaceae bacterium]